GCVSVRSRHWGTRRPQDLWLGSFSFGRRGVFSGSFSVRDPPASPIRLDTAAKGGYNHRKKRPKPQTVPWPGTISFRPRLALGISRHHPGAAIGAGPGLTERYSLMSISQAIAPHLPYLRRFARALSGTQAAGDAYVAATLEVLIAAPQPLHVKLDPRVALFRTFTGLWNSVGVNLKPDIQTSALTPADRKLESITPLPRQAFLLSAVEGFSAPDIASILGIDEDEVMEL